MAPELELLHRAYAAFLEAARAGGGGGVGPCGGGDPCTSSSGAGAGPAADGLGGVAAELQAAGLHGAGALRALEAHRRAIGWDAMAPDAFAAFYRFVFVICRDCGKRNMTVRAACVAASCVCIMLLCALCVCVLHLRSVP